MSLIDALDNLARESAKGCHDRKLTDSIDIKAQQIIYLAIADFPFLKKPVGREATDLYWKEYVLRREYYRVYK